MTEREKNGERLAMKISRHRQAKHEAIQYEDVKTAYIKGCEDTEKENADLPAIAYQQGAEAYKKKADAKLAKARALLAQWAQTSFAGACDNVNLAAETEQFLAGDL